MFFWCISNNNKNNCNNNQLLKYETKECKVFSTDFISTRNTCIYFITENKYCFMKSIYLDTFNNGVMLYLGTHRQNIICAVKSLIRLRSEKIIPISYEA